MSTNYLTALNHFITKNTNIILCILSSFFIINFPCVDSAAAKDMAGTGKKKVPDFIQKAPRRKDKVQTIF